MRGGGRLGTKRFLKLILIRKKVKWNDVHDVILSAYLPYKYTDRRRPRDTFRLMSYPNLVKGKANLIICNVFI